MPCPDTADTASSSSARSSPSISPANGARARPTPRFSRNLIRIWVEKAGDGQLDQEVVAADLLGAYEAKIAALERLVGQQTLEIEFLKERRSRPIGDKRDLVRDHRPDGLSVERGCALMGLARSTYYAIPQEKPSEAGLVAEIRGSPTNSSATAIAASMPSCATAAGWSTTRR